MVTNTETQSPRGADRGQLRRPRDYERIERAIRFLAEHADEQPGLERLAGHVHLSPWHLQRLFVSWAGVSPKEFLQSLTLARAKALLDDSRPVLDTAVSLGLSSSSRLHDLFIGMEAVTPGEYRNAGDGLVLHWTMADTPFGGALLAATDRGLCRLSFAANGAEAAERLREEWPAARLRRSPERLAPYVDELVRRMRGGAPSKRIGLVLAGTELRLKVWRALLEIPRGRLASYAEVAEMVGNPGAVRAVATAVANNPLAFLIPCHRVIRSTGALGEYRWGGSRKAVMLATEQAPRLMA